MVLSFGYRHICSRFSDLERSLWLLCHLKDEAGKQYLERKLWQQVAGWLLLRSKQDVTVAYSGMLSLEASEGHRLEMSQKSGVESPG